MLILVLFSVLSGVVTVLSPCILPVLPIVLSTAVARGRARPLGVVVGLILSFSVFTLAVSSLVSLLGISATALRLAAVIIIAILGLGMLLPALNTLFERALSRLPGLARAEATPRSGFAPGFLTGASLGLVWAPCAGPILAAVTTLAATRAVSSGVIWVVLAYAFGAGLPLLAIAYGGQAALRRVPALARNPLRVQRAFGLVMILTAGLIAFNADTLVTAWATSLVPSSWTASLQSFESSAPVSQQLAHLTGGMQPAESPQPAQSMAGVPVTGMQAQTPTSQPLPDLGPAPEITGISHWINSSPLTMQSLRGKVVLIDFWTYSCINCIRTLPYVTDWYQKYKDQGFVVIGVHSPEFAFEHETPNVEDATRRFKIAYPVAQDNDFATWQAYHNQYWPAEYLIDARGEIRHTQFGEGNYAETEQAIEQLLAEAGRPAQAALTQGPAVHFSGMLTPETYVGAGRLDPSAIAQDLIPGQAAPYQQPAMLQLNQFGVGGNWDFQPEFAQEMAPGSTMRLHFFASDVYLVMSSAEAASVQVRLDQPGQQNHSEDLGAGGSIAVKEARLYHLVKLDQAGEGTLTLTFDHPGVQVYAFTFGG